MVRVIPFQTKYAEDFKSINLEWLEEYIGVEEADYSILNDPERNIIQKGGLILLALDENELVGTICLEKTIGKTMITKLGVKKSHRGRGIGKQLCLAVLKEAQKRDLREVWLETSQKLQTAIQLYQKLGFEDMNTASRSSRCDVLMRLRLKPSIN
ncbi:MAG: GNAT family N-acetyltransferase [Cytophagia bacterium]|nr:GNAT family N-acetyltransferase [Cytophagia bacterium]